MPVDDLWYLTKRGPDDERLPSKRHGRGKRWRVRYNDDAGKPRERLFAKKKDADNFDANVRSAVSQGQYIDPDAGKLTVSEFGRQWRESRMHRDSTTERVERTFRLHVDPTALGRTQLAQARSSHVQAWVKDRAQYLAPTTLAVAYSYVASLFATAEIDRVVGSSPCQGIRLPEVPRHDRFIPTDEQVHDLADALPTRYRALPYVAAGCGLRQGEAWGLELEDVDFLRREVHVRHQLVTVNGKTFLAPAKTSTSVRTVELGTSVAEPLARHLELFPPVEIEIEDRTDARKPVMRRVKLLFLNARGNPLQSGPWSHPWVAAVAQAGLPKKFGYHGLRHYFATLLIHNGASVKTVQLALGHSTPTVTLSTYISEWPDAVDRTRTIVDRALSRGAGGLRAAQ